MKWVVTTAPATLPVTFAQCKFILRLDDTTARDDVVEMIRAAVDHAQEQMEASLITQTITATFYDSTEPLHLPRGPVQEIVSVTDDNGNDVTDFDLVRVGNSDRINLTASVAYPLVVVYHAGYGDDGDDVPPIIRHAIKMHVLSLFDQQDPPKSLADFYGLNSRRLSIG